MSVDAITPVAQDYLKAIWSATEWGGEPITTTALAARFGTTAPAVTDVVKRLAAQGLVEHVPYRPVRLTQTGAVYAVAMVRRHRLIETFLATALGYRWDEVHDEAERLEHAVSETFVDRIDAALGHPATDPHGDPIPSRTGATSLPDAVPLASVTTPGRYRVVRVSDADAVVLAVAAGLGVLPRADVVVPADLPTAVAEAAWVTRVG